MGERKGQNFYYPPDFDPKKHGNINGYHGVHALRERANKISEGILIIRFEMPFNIWCGSNAEDTDPNVKGCRKHIGIGVRYNAEKTRVAMYYTTPVYQFKMRCHMCSNPITIKTDPGNMDYIVVSGGRRVEQRWDPSGNGQLVPESKSVGRKLADDAMFKLEHESGDKGKSEQEEGPRLGKMFAIADRVKDDYLANSILRQKFRKAKKERLEAAAEVNQLKAKAGIDIDIVAERETDIKMAKLLSLQAHCDAEDVQLSLRDGIEDRDIFAKGGKTATNKKEVALHVLQKAASSKQKMMVKEKGFGVLVKKLQKKDSTDQLIQHCKLVSPASVSSTSSVSSATSPISSPPPANTSIASPPSLSLLGDYGSSGTDSD